MYIYMSLYICMCSCNLTVFLFFPTGRGLTSCHITGEGKQAK